MQFGDSTKVGHRATTFRRSDVWTLAADTKRVLGKCPGERGKNLAKLTWRSNGLLPRYTMHVHNLNTSAHTVYRNRTFS